MIKKIFVFFLIVFVIGIGITACTEGKPSERPIAHINFSSWIKESLTVSPDNKRVAYAEKQGDKQFVVVDGKEGKAYDDIKIITLIFSPDSKQVAYAAKLGHKWCAVVDGKEGKRYNGIFTTRGGVSIFFDAADSFHYLARIGEDIYLVEERIE